MARDPISSTRTWRTRTLYSSQSIGIPTHFQHFPLLSTRTLEVRENEMREKYIYVLLRAVPRISLAACSAQSPSCLLYTSAILPLFYILFLHP